MNIIKERRVGTFRLLPERLDHQPEQFQVVLATCIVVRCEYLYEDAALRYTAYSPHFEPSPPGKLREYVPCIHRDDPLGQMTVRWL